MIIISDTSPVSNLIAIGRLEILKTVFGEIIIPEAVYNEILKIKNFNTDVSSFENATWIRKEEIQDFNTFQLLRNQLDEGEAQAITLAKELKSEFLLIDEKQGRAIARAMGIKIIGLAGVLVKAKRENHIQLVKPILDELIDAKFWIDKKLYDEILRSVNE
jgi:predicted nucleic acid-binding protein